MPTPRVVRRRRAIRATMGLLVLGLAGAIVARVYLSRVTPLTPEEVAGLDLQEAEILTTGQQRARPRRTPSAQVFAASGRDRARTQL